ncbi:MAG TPA: VanZ family protein [Nitrospirae bacterium]|nr:VanZ family protein [Nitrospirota bacterium]
MNKAGEIDIRTAVVWWFVTIGYMGIIFYLSSLQDIDISRFPSNFDKVVHTCIYIPLSFLLYLSLRRIGIKKYIFIMAFVLASIYGISDEIHQLFVPGRDAAIGDVLADTLGAFIGSLAANFTKT